MEELRKKFEEQTKKDQEELRRKKEELRRKQEDLRRKQEELRRKQEEFRKQREEQRKRLEEQARRLNEEIWSREDGQWRRNNHDNYNNLIESKIKVDKLNEENKKCIICLEDFKDNDNAIFLPCFHVFHNNCIREWLRNKDFCPLCKINIKNNLINNF